MLFFPLVFSIYCCSIDHSVVCVVSGRCNWSFFVLFLMKSLSRLIDVSTLSQMVVSPLPPSFLDTYNLSMSFQGHKILRIVH